MLRILASRLGASTAKIGPKFGPRLASSRLGRVTGFQSLRQITTVEHIPKKRRWGLWAFGLTILGAYGYWKWLTFHKFPPTVAALLKEGLWATINGAGYRKPDYRKALAKYIEALQEADRLQMEPWSDEYTGIQIVIADLYERLHLSSEAAAMYAEIGNTYLMALNRNKIAPKDRDRIITRDLRVVLLAGLLMSTDESTFRAAVGLMGPHLIMATREAAKKSEELDFLLHQQPVFDTGYLRDIRTRQLPSDVLEGAWGSYKNEIIAMREMMTGIAAASGEYMQALTIKLKTTQIMLTSGFNPGECLLSAANIASLMYLESVSLRFTRPQQGEQNSEQPENPEEALEKATRNQSLVPTVTVPSEKPRKIVQPNSETFLKLSNDVYTEIIKTVKSLDQRRAEFVPEAYVMALYGQGVIATSKGDWGLAADRLEEARLRAKGSQLEYLIQTAEDEVSKVKKMRDLKPEEIAALRPNELPSVDVMFWKLMPDASDLDRPDLPEPKL